MPTIYDADDAGLLVRLRADDRDWARSLPRVPGRRSLTVTLGHPGLVPEDTRGLRRAGYQIVGVLDGRRGADHVDILVPADLRAAEVAWWERLRGAAERVFDLRMGPVQHVLAAEIGLHARAERCA